MSDYYKPLRWPERTFIRYYKEEWIVLWKSGPKWDDKPVYVGPAVNFEASTQGELVYLGEKDGN